METKNVMEQLLKKGSKLVKNVIKNVTVTPLENYVRLGLTLDKPVVCFKASEDGTYKEDEVKVIFVSLFSITAQLKENGDTSCIVNHLLKNPMGCEVLLSNATIDVIQEKVEGEEYVNPWSENENAVKTVMTHDTYINHVVNLRLSPKAVAIVDKIALSLVGL